MQKLSIGETVREAPTADLTLEQKSRATLAEAHKDYVSRDLIELIGEPNYLQSAVGGPDENKSQASGGD